MADIVIDAASSTSTSRVGRALRFTSALVGYYFFIDADDAFKYSKTTNGGVTWGAPVTIVSGTVLSADVWFDQDTPGDIGTLFHTWVNESGVDDLIYRALNAATDTLGTAVTVFAGLTSAAATACHVSGTKARGGNLLVAFCLDNGAELGTYRSTDGGATWGVRTNLVEAASGSEHYFLFPGNEADPQDVWCLYLDASAGAITLKVHDDSANTNSESASICAGLTLGQSDLTAQYIFSGAVRHSDGHLVFASYTDYDPTTATLDLRVFDVTNSTTFVELTALATNITGDSNYPSVFIDQLTDDIYVAYVGKRDGSESLGTTTSICYSVSTDGGTTWGTEIVYSAAASDWRRTWSPSMGLRFIVAWRDISSIELLTNSDNSLTFVAAAEDGGFEGFGFASGFAINLIVARFKGEGEFRRPGLDLAFQVPQMGGELQAAPPELLTFGWGANFGAEGAFTPPNLVTYEFRATLRGEGFFSMPDLTLFPGWAAVLSGEGAFVALPDLTAYGFRADFIGEGAFAALPDLTLGLPFVEMRGELQAIPPYLSLPIVFSASLRGEGGFRTSPSLTLPFSTMDGNAIDAPIGVLDGTIQISEAENTVTTSQLTVVGLYPDVGGKTEIALGVSAQFFGRILRTKRFYIEGKNNSRTGLEMVGFGWHLTRRRITDKFYNQSATEVILRIMSKVSGFDLTRVQGGLPTIDQISFSGARLDNALTQTIERIGGSWRVDPPNFLVAGFAEEYGIDPEPLTPTHPTLKNFIIVVDLGSVANRITVKGAGTSIIAAPEGEFPDYWRSGYPYGVDHTRFYPSWSQRLYVQSLDTGESAVLDNSGVPVFPARSTPGETIFGGGGTAIIDDVYEVGYSSSGVQSFHTSVNVEMFMSSMLSGSLQPHWTFDPDRSMPLQFIGGYRYLYYLTVVTQWGESTPRLQQQGQLGYDWEYRYLDGSPDLTPWESSSADPPMRQWFFPHRSIVLTIRASDDIYPGITGYKVYRRAIHGNEPYDPTKSDAAIIIGSVPRGGGVIVDSKEAPPLGTEDERPTEDTSMRPPMPYIDIQIYQPVRVGASIRIMTTVNDFESQALIGNYLDDDGVIEGDPVDDGSLTSQNLESTGLAHLKIRSPLNTTITWDCRDPNAGVGKTQAIDMPDFRGVVKIKSVSSDSFEKANYNGVPDTISPTRHVTATTQLKTITQLLRKRR